uniref:MFS domain-containing protein n=1 Tax=Haemonchus contortus TaxID=6289 RepID=A0A7I4Y657_HAECO
MGRGPLCCCCMANNVRHMVLVLTSVCVSVLFTNLILFNLTAVLDPELSTELRPVPSLDSLHEYTIWHDRRKRSINETDDPKLSFPGSGEDKEGRPILPEVVTKVTTSSTTIAPTIKTTENTRLVFFTNSPIPANFTTTTIPTPVVPDPRDVVRNEVQKAIDRLEGRGEDVVKPSPLIDTDETKDEMTLEPSFESQLTRYLLYAAPGFGCLIGVIPAIFFVRFCGTRATLSVALAMSAILTVLLPLLSQFGFLALFPLRLLIGVSFAPALPVAGAICASWGCLNEQLLFIGTVFAFIHMAPLLSWPLTMLVFSNEFPLFGIYAAHAVVTLFLSVLFALFHRDRPQHHPWVNGLELNRIVAGKVQELKSNRAQDGACPTLMRSLAAWSLWIAAFSLFFAVAVVVTYMPSALSCQEIFMVDYLGGYSVLPFILIPIVMVAAGLTNRWSCCSSTAHVRVWNSISAGLTALLFIALPIVFHLQEPSATVYFLMLLLAPLGLCVSGLLRSLCLVGRVYTQHITAFIAVSFAVAFITAPLLIFAILRTNSLAEWSRVFMLSAAVIAISSVVFAIFGRGRASNWAAASWDPLMSTKMRNLQPIDFSQDECGLYELRLIDPNKK